MVGFSKIHLLSLLLETDLLQKLLITLLLQEYGRTVAAVMRHQHTDHKIAAAVLTAVFQFKGLDPAIAAEKILNDHFRLAATIIICPVGKRYIHPVIKKTG